MSQSFDINVLCEEARTRWLRPAEVYYILQNHERFPITPEPPKKPPSGSLFLYNRRVNRYFRRDGHAWRRKKDGRTVGEAHERLKVGNVDALSCYYAHGEQNPCFQRRCGTMAAAIELIKDRGADVEQIRIISAITCPPAIERLREKFPGICVYVAALDPVLNEKGFMIPGLGDAGDRIYGT